MKIDNNSKFFVDGNYDCDIVYVGSEKHMEGLAFEGGSVFEVDKTYAQGRTVRPAPDHWLKR
jgi:hypothetical protein